MWHLMAIIGDPHSYVKYRYNKQFFKEGISLQLHLSKVIQLRVGELNGF